MSPKHTAVLALNRLRRLVRLGCTPEERAAPQEVLFDLEIRFCALPRASETDALEDAICYAGLASALSEVCARGEFRLIERLGLEAFRAVRERTPRVAGLTLTVTKVRPPVPGLEGGASFRVQEDPA